jgi:hypothetical protein
MNARIVSTHSEAAALPPRTVVSSAGGTIACRYDAGRGLVFGDERTFCWDVLELPLRILFCPTCELPPRDLGDDDVCPTCGRNYSFAIVLGRITESFKELVDAVTGAHTADRDDYTLAADDRG